MRPLTKEEYFTIQDGMTSFYARLTRLDYPVATLLHDGLVNVFKESFLHKRTGPGFVITVEMTDGKYFAEHGHNDLVEFDGNWYLVTEDLQTQLFKED